MTGDIVLKGPPTAALHPVTKTYADDAVALLMPKAGGSFSGDVTFATTTATLLPVGTTAQRPAGVAGKLRYNSQTGYFEGYGTSWGSLTTTAYVDAADSANATAASNAQATASAASTTANAAMPRAGGSFSGAVTFATTDATQLPSGTTAQRPAGTAGQIRYNSTTQTFEGFGSAWGALGGVAAVGTVAPANPVQGTLWFKSDEGQGYVYYDDGNTKQWVPFGGGAGLVPAP